MKQVLGPQQWQMRICTLRNWADGHFLEWDVSKVSLTTCTLELFQDLMELDMKPCMHLVEISIFLLYDVTVRLVKIMNNLLEHLKILIFKVIFSVENWSNLSSKKSLKNIARRPTFIKKMGLKILIFKILHFLRMCTIFVGSVNYFVRSDGVII